MIEFFSATMALSHVIQNNHLVQASGSLTFNFPARHRRYSSAIADFISSVISSQLSCILSAASLEQDDSFFRPFSISNKNSNDFERCERDREAVSEKFEYMYHYQP